MGQGADEVWAAAGFLQDLGEVNELPVHLESIIGHCGFRFAPEFAFGQVPNGERSPSWSN